MIRATDAPHPPASRLPVPDDQESWLLFDTRFGRCAIAWSDDGITRTRLPGASDEATARSIASGRRHVCGGDLPHHAARAIVALQRYFAGRPLELDDIPVDLGATSAFERTVLTALRTVKRGTTTTYGALARLVGEPGAARAVGMAMARNPVPVISHSRSRHPSGTRRWVPSTVAVHTQARVSPSSGGGGSGEYQPITWTVPGLARRRALFARPGAF